MLPHSKIYVAGHNGLAGSAIWRELQRQGFTHLLGRRSSELDLAQTEAEQMVANHPIRLPCFHALQMNPHVICSTYLKHSMFVQVIHCNSKRT